MYSGLRRITKKLILVIGIVLIAILCSVIIYGGKKIPEALRDREEKLSADGKLVHVKAFSFADNKFCFETGRKDNPKLTIASPAVVEIYSSSHLVNIRSLRSENKIQLVIKDDLYYDFREKLRDGADFVGSCSSPGLVESCSVYVF